MRRPDDIPVLTERFVYLPNQLCVWPPAQLLLRGSSTFWNKSTARLAGYLIRQGNAACSVGQPQSVRVVASVGCAPDCDSAPTDHHAMCPPLPSRQKRCPAGAAANHEGRDQRTRRVPRSRHRYVPAPVRAPTFSVPMLASRISIFILTNTSESIIVDSGIFTVLLRPLCAVSSWKRDFFGATDIDLVLANFRWRAVVGAQRRTPPSLAPLTRVSARVWARRWSGGVSGIGTIVRYRQFSAYY